MIGDETARDLRGVTAWQIADWSPLDPETQRIGRIRAKIWLSIEEASEYLGFAKGTLYHFTSRRAIPYYKFNEPGTRGSRLKFKRSELDEWMTRFRVQQLREPHDLR